MKTRKTGLAERIRAWASARNRAFRPNELWEGLGVPKGPGRDKVRPAIRDFVTRGEIHRVRNGRLRYNSAWQKQRNGKLKAKILKAMYVSLSKFAASDLQRLSDAPNRNYVHKVLRELLASRHIRKVGQRSCLYGTGVENLFTIVNRDNFRIEVLG